MWIALDTELTKLAQREPCGDRIESIVLNVPSPSAHGFEVKMKRSSKVGFFQLQCSRKPTFSASAQGVDHDRRIDDS